MRQHDVRLHDVPWMSVGNLRWRRLVHVHVNMQYRLLHQVPGLPYIKYLPDVLRL